MMPSGKAMTTAPTVTSSEPKSSGEQAKAVLDRIPAGAEQLAQGDVEKHRQPFAQQKEKDQGDDDNGRDACQLDNALDDHLAPAAVGCGARAWVLPTAAPGWRPFHLRSCSAKPPFLRPVATAVVTPFRPCRLAIRRVLCRPQRGIRLCTPSDRDPPCRHTRHSCGIGTKPRFATICCPSGPWIQAR